MEDDYQRGMMSSHGKLLLIGGTSLVAALFILPTPLFEVFSGRADGAAYVLFAVGALLLVEGLALVTMGLRNRSKDLRTARTYENREGSTSDEDRPANPHDYPSAGRQGQVGGPL